MNIKYKNLIQGSEYQIKDTKYNNVKYYLEKIISEFELYNYEELICSAKSPSEIGYISKMNERIYDKVNITALKNKPVEFNSNIYEALNITYSLIDKKCIFKLSKTYYDKEKCTHYIFDTKLLNTFIFDEENEFDESIIIDSIKDLLETPTKNIIDYLNYLDNIVMYPMEFIKNHFGTLSYSLITMTYLASFGKVKLTANNMNVVIKKLFHNEKSNSYIPEGETISMKTIYDEMNYLIYNDKDKDIFNRFEKSLFLYQLIENEIKNIE